MKKERREKTETRPHHLQSQDLAEVRGCGTVLVKYNGQEGP